MKFKNLICAAIAFSLFGTHGFALTQEMKAVASEKVDQARKERLQMSQSIKRFAWNLKTIESDLTKPSYKIVNTLNKVTTALLGISSVYLLKDPTGSTKSHTAFFVATILSGVTNGLVAGNNFDIQKLSKDLLDLSNKLKEQNGTWQSKNADFSKFGNEMEALAKELQNSPGSEFATRLARVGSTLTTVFSSLVFGIAASSTSHTNKALLMGILGATSGVIGTGLSTIAMMTEPDRMIFLEQIRNLRLQAEKIASQMDTTSAG